MKKLLACLAFAAVANLAVADSKPFNLSLTPDIAVQDRGDMIEGLTLSIWGENQQKSLALGFVNGTKGDSAGLSIGLMNYADNYRGVQWSFVNYAKGDVTGWQDGAVNYVEGEMHGLQSGWINYAGKLRGLQLGLVNYAETVTAGVQIGLLNLIPQNDSWFGDLPDAVAPGMIFVNWRF